jgi:L,D-transpeptidase catalytic domain
MPMITASGFARSIKADLASVALIAALVGCVLIGAATQAAARSARGHGGETAPPREIGIPLMAIVALREQRVTIYDAQGSVLRAPVSTGQGGYETPAGIYSVIQKEAEHFSNLYDDASMPFMQRITWSGIALHAGVLPGYPASHGCVRMPYEFAEHLFELTKIGMRVLVVPRDVAPADFAHSVLFKPAPVGGELALAAGPAAGDVQPIGLATNAQPSPPPQRAPTLRSIAEAKAAEADAAARRADAARLAALRAQGEAMRVKKALRTAEAAVARASLQLKDAERAAEGAQESTPLQQAGVQADANQAKLRAVLAKAQGELAAAQAAGQPAIEAALATRESVKAAEAARVAAVAAAKEAAARMAPVSVFISKQEQRLYVRQALQPVFESPISIGDADRSIGTHIFTALDYAQGGAELRWSVVSMTSSEAGGHAARPRLRREAAEPLAADVAAARAALDRISIPEEALSRISEVVSPGSSLIVSDEPLSRETGKGTDFVVLMSGEPQGGIKMRRHNPMGYPMGYGRRYDSFMRPWGRSPYRSNSWW